MQFLEALNPTQRKAVEQTQGPVMIIAGAGSGKTRVLTYRIAYLLETGTYSNQILALTFTNKAAKEMKKRIEKLVGPEKSKHLWMGTFHAVFSKILRIEASKIGYTSNFTIYDTDDCLSLIKSIVKEQNLSDEIYKPRMILGRISQSKNNLISFLGYLSNNELQKEDAAAQKSMIGQIYQTYQTRLRQADAMDFDDLLFNTNILLRDHQDVLQKYQQKFKYILVDEYQDTNFSQYFSVKKLSAQHQNICIVGDDAQSIYAFRGANIQNILNFKNDYPQTKIYKLEENYRSTKFIVEAANQVIKKNTKQLEKNSFTMNGQGEGIQLLKSNSDKEEGDKIAFHAKEYGLRHQVHYKNMAVLYRTNAQSRPLEEAFRKQGIPYKILGGMSFYKRKEVKDAIAYFRLTINPYDEEALKRIINYPTRGIGKTTLDKLFYYANEQKMAPWDIMNKPELLLPIVGKGGYGSIQDFLTMVTYFQQLEAGDDIYETAKSILVQSQLFSEIRSDKTPEGISKYENLKSLLEGIQEYKDTNQGGEELINLSRYLQEVALLTDADEDKKDDANSVTLMTIHASKGLEFQYVCIAGMEENLFPSALSVNSLQELEEERRLFYVALTRAEKYLTISFAMNRYKYNISQPTTKSRFLKDIEPSLFKNPDAITEVSRGNPFNNPDATRLASTRIYAQPQSKLPATKPVGKTNLSQVNTISQSKSPQKNYQIGMLVEHPKFGVGTIENIIELSGKEIATINFKNEGIKKVVLHVISLEIIDN